MVVVDDGVDGGPGLGDDPITLVDDRRLAARDPLAPLHRATTNRLAQWGYVSRWSRSKHHDGGQSRAPTAKSSRMNIGDVSALDGTVAGVNPLSACAIPYALRPAPLAR